MSALARLSRSRPPARGGVVGLDIAASAIRGVQAGGSADRPTGVRWGAVDLAPGSIEYGEIVDAPAVSAALRQLWKSARFTSRSVVVGMASHQVVSRQIQLPKLGEKDLRSALRFELADMLPFPIEETTCDLRVYEELEDPDSNVTLVRAAAVAAHRPAVQALIDCLAEAGLRVRQVDLPPFALVRGLSLVTRDHATEAIIQVSEDALSLVVHRGGRPRFARVVLLSGVLDHADAGALEDELSWIEQYQHRDAGTRARTARRRDPLVDAIRATLEFYGSQEDARPIERVCITGDPQRSQTLATTLGAAVPVPVILAAPLDPQMSRQTGPDYVQAGLAAYSTAFGLALRPGGEVVGPEPLDLLPERDRASDNRMLASAALGSTLVGVLAVGALSLIGGSDGSGSVADAEGRTATAQARITELADELAGLEDFRRDGQEFADRRAQGLAARSGEVDWERILAAIEERRPADSLVVSVRGASAAAPDAASSATPPPAGSVGSVELAVEAASPSAVGLWLEALEAVPGVANPTVAGTSVPSGGRGAAFTILATLTPDALVPPPSGPQPGQVENPDDGAPGTSTGSTPTTLTGAGS